MRPAWNISTVAMIVLSLLPLAAQGQWLQSNGPYAGEIRSILIDGNNVFAGSGGSGIYRSSDGGTSWTPASSGLTNMTVNCFAVNGAGLFAGTYNGLFRSTDNGKSWFSSTSGLPSPNIGVGCLAVIGTNIFAGVWNNGVFRSTDGGTSWNPTSLGLFNKDPWCLAVSGTDLFAGTTGGLFYSGDSGGGWAPAGGGLPNGNVEMLGASRRNLFAAPGGCGIFRSTDRGSNWSPVSSSLSSATVNSFAFAGTKLFAAIRDSGIYVATDSGTAWTPANSGLNSAFVYSLAVCGTNLFAGVQNGGVWRRPLSEMVTSAGLLESPGPTEYALEQNYPNPFNPTTTIKFELPRASHVNLSVFDILGREVSVLVNERKDGGVYEMKFDGSGMASGVYFYRLQAGTYGETKKLLLLH